MEPPPSGAHGLRAAAVREKQIRRRFRRKKKRRYAIISNYGLSHIDDTSFKFKSEYLIHKQRIGFRFWCCFSEQPNTGRRITIYIYNRNFQIIFLICTTVDLLSPGNTTLMIYSILVEVRLGKKSVSVPIPVLKILN